MIIIQPAELFHQTNNNNVRNLQLGGTLRVTSLQTIMFDTTALQILWCCMPPSNHNGMLGKSANSQVWSFLPALQCGEIFILRPLHEKI